MNNEELLMNSPAALLMRLSTQSNVSLYKAAEHADIHLNTVYNWTGKQQIQPTVTKYVKVLEGLGYRLKVEKI